MQHASNIWPMTTFAVVLGVGCTAGPCPDGTRLLGTRCLAVFHADAAVEDGAREDDACHRDAGPSRFGCELGPSQPEHACAASCDAPGCAEYEDCAPPPEPEILGAASMAPELALWAWAAPIEGVALEATLDGAPLVDLPADGQFRPILAPGAHTLLLRGCSVRGVCSSWARHTAQVESFAPAAPRALSGVARTFGVTAIGRSYAIGCADCLAGPPALALAGHAWQLEGALLRGADIVTLAVARVKDEFVVGLPEPVAPSTLAALLASPSLRAASALVLLDLSLDEPSAARLSPEIWAEQLFALIDAAPDAARNGRPLWLRTRYASRAHLVALHGEARRHPVTGPYVRFVVADPGGEARSFYAQGPEQPLVPSLPFVDAVTVDYRTGDLLDRLARSRSAGHAVIVDGLPAAGLDGAADAILAALREQADVLLTHQTVDAARVISAAPNLEYYFDARSLSAERGAVRVERADGAGVAEAHTVPLATPPTPPPELVTSARPTSQQLPPYLDVCAGCGFVYVGGPLPASTPANGALLSYFGTLSGTPTAGLFDILVASERSALARIDGRMVVQPAMAQDALGLPPSWSFEVGALLATCEGTPIALADLAVGAHWIIAFSADGSRWSVVLDGRCALSSGPIALISSAAQLGSFVTINQSSAARAVQAAGVLRWPPVQAAEPR